MYERIRHLRQDNDLTQAQVAEYLNIHQTTYSDYELGNLN
ncbi:MAG: helix-turn-helix transcriptional regulator, partial [Peptococcia bacterium]